MKLHPALVQLSPMPAWDSVLSCQTIEVERETKTTVGRVECSMGFFSAQKNTFCFFVVSNWSTVLKTYLLFDIISAFISHYSWFNVSLSGNDGIYLPEYCMAWWEGFFILPKKQDNILLVGGLAEPRCSFSIFMTERCARNCFHTPSHFICSSLYAVIFLSIHLSVLPFNLMVAAYFLYIQSKYMADSCFSLKTLSLC